jgi:hypothetical protein
MAHLPALVRLSLHPSVATGAPKRKRVDVTEAIRQLDVLLENFDDDVRNQAAEEVVRLHPGLDEQWHTIPGGDYQMRRLFEAEKGTRPQEGELITYRFDLWTQGLTTISQQQTNAQAQVARQDARDDYNAKRAAMEAAKKSRGDAADGGAAFFNNLDPDRPSALTMEPEYYEELRRKEGTLSATGTERGPCM